MKRILLYVFWFYVKYGGFGFFRYRVVSTWTGKQNKKGKKNVFQVIEKCFSKHVWKTLLILKVLHVYDHFAQISF